MRRFLAATGLFLLSAACTGEVTEPANTDETSETAPTEAQAEPSLTDTRWQWVGTLTPVERIDIGQPERYTLRLEPGGEAQMQFDCNSGRGGYELDENRISFGPMISTRMACPPDTQDFVFMTQLEAVASFFIMDGELFLEMPADAGTMRFRQAPDDGQD